MSNCKEIVDIEDIKSIKKNTSNNYISPDINKTKK